VLGEVDRFRRAGVSLGWGELAEGTARPVDDPQQLLADLAGVTAIDVPRKRDHRLLARPTAPGLSRQAWQ
jgi:hypothetical protein